MTQQYNFTPQWLSGFTQADGSFTVTWSKHGGTIPIRPRPTFVLTQTVRDLSMMQALHAYLGVGDLQINRDSANIVVRSTTELMNTIIPLFDANPVLGAKLYSYLIFKKVVMAMANKEHLSLAGTLSLLNLSYFIHSTSLRTEDSLDKLMEIIKNKFGTLPEVAQLEVVPLSIPFTMSIQWLAGIIDGDGSFNFAFKGTRRRVVANFTIVMGLGDEPALLAVQSFLGCGQIYFLAENASRFQVENINTLVTKVLPILQTAHFNTVKQTYFGNTVLAWGILAEHGISSDTYLKTIVDLVYDMNLEGVRRKLTKEQYLNKFITKTS